MAKTIRSQLESIQDNIQAEKYNLNQLEVDEEIKEKVEIINNKLHDIYWDLNEIINQD